MPKKSSNTEPGNFPGSTDVVVYEVPEPGECWQCNKTTHLLAGPDHSPRDGGAHYICSGHMDPDAVVQQVSVYPFKGMGLKLLRKCQLCSTPTTNRVYCSRACRLVAVYPEWETRRAKVIALRDAGASFAEIGAALGVSDARASAIYHHQKGAQHDDRPKGKATAGGATASAASL